ncbi:MAG: DUF177 domain-containing protein [Alphaproteobacteria bacterium]
MAPGETAHFRIEADTTVQQALARRLGILSVDAAMADLAVVLSRNGRVVLSGTLKATVTQSCIVTLDPVTTEIDTAIDVLVLPPGDPGPAEADLDMDGPDIDGHDGHSVDLGEILTQTLSLRLPDYPRVPGAAVPEGGSEPPEEEERVNPFAVLARLKENGGS